MQRSVPETIGSFSGEAMIQAGGEVAAIAIAAIATMPECSRWRLLWKRVADAAPLAITVVGGLLSSMVCR